MSSIFFNDMVKAYLDDGIELLRELSFDGPGVSAGLA
jgi:hypothetical protein